MHLFDIVGEDFFKPLTGKNRITFIDCINIIYNMCSNELSYGTNREYVASELAAYFESQSDELVFDEGGISVSNPREKAGAVIRRLKECNWVDLESTSDYKIILNLSDHAVTVIEALRNISQNKELEYETSISQIYNTFNNPKLYGKPYEYIIKPVYSNTKELITGLKKLNTNIKKYIDGITNDKEADEIIREFFEYQNNIGSKAFQRIHTSDNVSLFRNSIKKNLWNIQYNESILAEVIKGYMKIEEIEDETTARSNIQDILLTISNAFDYRYDEIVREITAKHEKYINSAIARAKFLLSNSNDIEGKLSVILQFAVNEINNADGDLYDFAENEIDSLFEILPLGFIDNESLAPIPINRKIGEPEEIFRTYGISDEDRQAHRLKLQLAGQNKFSRKNIYDFIEKLLSENECIKASSLSLYKKRDILRIIYIKLYGQYGKSPYTVKNIPDEIMINGKFRFNDFYIEKRR